MLNARSWYLLGLLPQVIGRPHQSYGGRRVDTQAHRGGAGMRTEESLYAFAYAMEIGADTLEMDTVFTSEGIPVIWHDHMILGTKCKGDYVGQFFANLTLAQVKSMDCGLQLPEFPQAEVHPGTHIATLEEVLELVACYEDDSITINLETKLDPTTPNQTLSVETYIKNIWPIIQNHNFDERTTIESFDWRTLIGIKNKWPEVQTVALIDPSKIIPDSHGNFPWLGGLDLQKQFNGDWVAAAAYINASALSPLHGVPAAATQFTPGYTAFTDKDVVDRAHAMGMTVVPWTVDNEVLITKMIEDGVDAVISNYPERVLWMGARSKVQTGKSPRKHRRECLGKA